MATMEFEKLALDVRAHFAGLSIIKPPFVVGSSGVRHRFTFLASKGSELFAFDICENVGVEEVIRTFAKSLDTSAKACIINLGGRIDSETLQLASAYGIRILSPGEIQNLFTRQAVQVQNVVIRLRGPLVLEA
jgi:hypothetical protein